VADGVLGELNAARCAVMRQCGARLRRYALAQLLELGDAKREILAALITSAWPGETSWV
jgi:hypothetical protein